MNMDNQITGSSSDPLINPSLAGHLDPTTGETIASPLLKTTSDVSPSEFQVLEGVDVLDSGRVVVQQFIAEQRWGKKDYQADLRQPVLQIPDPEGATGPQPFEPSWQKAANKFFKEQVKEFLISKNKESNQSTDEGKNRETISSSPQNQPQQNINEKGSRQEDNPQLSQPLIEAQVNTIIQAVITGKMQTLTKDEQDIVTKATEKTQQSWSLPNSWSLGTQEIKDWTPITTEVIAPVNVDIFRREILTQNVEKLCVSIEDVSKKVMGDLPPDDPKRLAVGDVIRILAQAIRDLKEILHELQVLDSDIANVMSKSKFEQVAEHQKQIEENFEKTKELGETRKKQAAMAKLMKILAPIISAIVILIGAIALPFTGGASTTLIVAGLVIAAVMLAYTGFDAAFDLTSKAINAFNKAIEKIDEPWARTLVKVFTLVAVAIILIVAIAASGGTAAGSVASQIAAQVGKQLTIQFAITFIMSSNILPDLITQSLISNGVVNEKDEMTKLIIQMVIMALTMIATMGVIAKGEGAFRSLGSMLSQGAQSVGQAVRNFGSAIARLATVATEQGFKAALAELKQMIEALIRMLKQLMTQIGNQIGSAFEDAFKKLQEAAKAFSNALSKAGTSVKESLTAAKKAVMDAANLFLDSLKNLDTILKNAAQEASEASLQALKSIAKSTLESLNNVAQGMKEFIPQLSFQALNDMLEGAKHIFKPKEFLQGLYLSAHGHANQVDWPTIIQSAQDFFKIAGLSVEIGGSIYIGCIGLKIVDLLHKLGDITKAEETTQLMIKLFQKLLASFQEGLTTRGEWLNNLDQALGNIYGSASQTLTKATQQSLA